MAYQAIISCVADLLWWIQGEYVGCRYGRSWDKSDRESALHGVNGSAKWQPDLYPSVAIGGVIVSATKFVHLQESHFLVFV